MVDTEPLLALTNIPVNVAVIDSAGTIVGVNGSWREFADANGSRMHGHGIGLNYLNHCGRDGQGIALRSDIIRLLDRQLDALTTVYPCHSPDQVRWCLMIGLPLARSRSAGAVLMHANLTNLLPLVFSVRELDSAVSSLSTSDSVQTLRKIADAVQRLLATASSPLAGEAVSAPRRNASLARQQVDRARLSARHRQVFAMLGNGKSNEEIATALGLSHNTVKVHVSQILKRLGLNTRTQVALLASTIAHENGDRHLAVHSRPKDPRRRRSARGSNA